MNKKGVRDLQSIQAPGEILGVLPGAQKTEQGLQLPAHVTVCYSDGDKGVQAVRWDVAACGYDPQARGAQRVQVQGTIQLDDCTTNTMALPLDIQATVLVDKMQTIDIAAQGPGSVQPEGIVSVPEGESCRVTIQPNANARIERIYVDGNPQQNTSDAYCFDSVDTSHSLLVVFAGEGASAVEFEDALTGVRLQGQADAGLDASMGFYTAVLPPDVSLDGVVQAHTQAKNIYAYEASMVTKDGRAIQPASAVRVGLPLPEGASANPKDYLLLSMNMRDGIAQRLESFDIQNGYVTFATDRLQTFILAERLRSAAPEGLALEDSMEQTAVRMGQVRPLASPATGDGMDAGYAMLAMLAMLTAIVLIFRIRSAKK